MSESLQGAMIGIGGVIFGAILAFLFQLLLDRLNSKRENRRNMYQLKIETYADAIRYIALCCTEYQQRNDLNYNQIREEQDNLYNKFHPIFSMIAPRDVIEKYNNLRNEASDGKIKHADAYQKVIDILNFNVNDEI